MSIKGIVFLLFLYLLLAWTIAGLLYPQDFGQIRDHGLLWSAIGIGAMLLWLVLQQVLGWWRLRRTRAKAAPAQPAAVPPRQMNPDDSEFAALIAQADRVLAGAPQMAQRRVRDLPIYLLLGADGSGKTSLLHSAGIDARLLAGQVLGSGAAVSGTRLANIWLANECIFLEVSGRVFQSDVVRWGEFLSVLQPPVAAKSWRSLRSPEVQQIQLRGAILCCDVRSLSAGGDRTALERSAHFVRERLLKIAEIFRMRCPVYAMFTKTDTLPYFAEFFDRLPEGEAGQPFGVLTAADGAAGKAEEGVWADAELKKLGRDFNGLFLCLSARRLLNLSYEPTPARKPAIYEFPREFKRIRTPVVQYLIDALRPDPLRLSPILRGFFFAGTRKVESAAGSPFEITGQVKEDRGSHEATVIFRPDATQFSSALPSGSRPPGGLVDRSVFTRDFFQQVLPKDRPPVAVIPAGDPRVERNRMIAIGTAAAFAVLLSGVWTVSWVNNRALIDAAEPNINSRKSQGLSVDNLQAVDNLRRLLVDRLDPPRRLSMNWGLYTGDKIRASVREAYFGRLQQLVLNAANEHLADQLRHAGSGGSADSYDAVLGRLKTHLSVTGGICKLESDVVRRNMRQAVDETHPNLDATQKDLIGKQIDYYAVALSDENPVQLRRDNEAVNKAQAFLRNSNGPDQLYSSIIAQVVNGAPKVVVGDHVQGYKAVISAPLEVPFEFTKDGQAKFEKIADNGVSKLPTNETCVLGAANEAQAVVASLTRQVKSIYYKKYANSWKNFLDQTNVKRFESFDVAAQNLDVLSSSTSPLLGIVKFVGENTSFAVQKTQEDSGLVDRLVNKAKKAVTKQAAALESLRKPAFGAANVTSMFQPVQLTVQPDSPKLIYEANQPYIDGLRGLQKMAGPDRDAAIPQLNAAVSQAKGGLRKLTDGFAQENTEGVDVRVGAILSQPIDYAERLIPLPPKPIDPNTEIRKLCSENRVMFGKYPFSQHTKEDSTPDEIATVFRPETGKVWIFVQKFPGSFTKKGNRWEQSPDAKSPVDRKMLGFLNRAQELSDALFAGNAQLPTASYTLRPTADQDVKFKLQIDGVLMATPVQTNFHWPATGVDPHAECNAVAPAQYGCGNYPGRWAVFRLFEQAHDRPLRTKEVIWTKMLTKDGEEQAFTPVKVDIVEFPGGADLFNPQFFDPLRACPSQAVSQ